jgi:hypothetical protein
MTWADVIRAPKPRVVRQFSMLGVGVLGAIGLWQILGRDRPVLGGVLVGIGLLCGGLGQFAPRLMRWVFTGAMLLVFPIGFIVSQVMLLILFFLVFLPTGLLLRLRGWDPMLRHNRNASGSVWEPKVTPRDVRRYLRQY